MTPIHALIAQASDLEGPELELVVFSILNAVQQTLALGRPTAAELARIEARLVLLGGFASEELDNQRFLLTEIRSLQLDLQMLRLGTTPAGGQPS